MNFKITKCNVFDNQVIKNLIKCNNNNNNKKESKLFGDKGYMRKEEIKEIKKEKKKK